MKFHGLTQLVWFDTTNDICVALEPQQHIKSCNRLQKRELMDSHNPDWSDLSSEYILESFYSDLIRSRRGLARDSISGTNKKCPGSKPGAFITTDF